ncbi:hypothetical protein POM88_018068 [Heracleum sosnowskyi]|uniref:non-specific serine/threonine protein kinase n=1 Tax=Heracleum sosnowskyi TaxID=360622 RepID=A0AAD8ITQ3_9APIA|nr:hypothetical protein POM88_018068 [Heracleum sosnowskyi]
MKELYVMKSLKGHSNIVTLCAHTIMDMGRTKEALFVMEYCEKSLVNVLESRGDGYYEEKEMLAIFRDVMLHNMSALRALVGLHQLLRALFKHDGKMDAQL